MSLLSSKSLIPMGLFGTEKKAGSQKNSEIWPAPSRGKGTRKLSIFVRGSRTGLRLLRSPQKRYVWVEVELENLTKEKMPIPRGAAAVLVDSVGYAYRDLNPLTSKKALVPGEHRRMRYLFKAPADLTIGKLHLLTPKNKRIAETGFVDLTLPSK